MEQGTADALRTRTCKFCLTEFSYTVSRGTDRLYCTPRCRKDRALGAAANLRAHLPRCTVDGCTKPIRSAHAQWCEMHYARTRRHGSIDRRTRQPTGRCHHCGTGVQRQRVFCSSACQSRDKRGVERPTNGVTPSSLCEVCEATFHPKTRHARRYCSQPCASLAGRIRRYGLSLDAYQAMVDDQGSACAVCGSTDRLVIDHDHSTAVVRGLLCGGCNVGIGSLRDSPDLMRSAIAYLEAHSVMAGQLASRATTG